VKESSVENPVIVARDGQEALDHLLAPTPQSSNDRVALVLLDLKMPRIDGFEVLRRIKEIPELRSIPVVVFTSSQDPRDIHTSYLCGATAVLTKPNSFDELKSTLGSVSRFWTNTNARHPS
jgi:two-component system response regulator